MSERQVQSLPAKAVPYLPSFFVVVLAYYFSIPPLLNAFLQYRGPSAIMKLSLWLLFFLSHDSNITQLPVTQSQHSEFFDAALWTLNVFLDLESLETTTLY